MIRATIKKSATLFLALVVMAGFSVQTNAQDKPAFDGEFIFFINGANVKIPTVNGDVVVDPLDPTSDNRVFRINYADWSESGFHWPSGGHRDTVGVDASSLIGENYGESDTLYFKFLSDPDNIGKNDFIAFMDSDDGETNVNENPDTDLPFRLRWTIPAWAHDGEWHEFAIPLPPATLAQLDSAKAGVTFAGDSLEIEVDSLFMNWNYAGAWANGSATGHWDQSDPFWSEFDWEAVKYFGRHVDHADGGAAMYFDYFSLGVPPSELTDTPPDAVSSVTIDNVDGVNTVTWSTVEGAGGYKVYFSESEIADILADGVVLLGTRPFDGELSVEHSIIAPHQTLATDFEAHYAVTATSEFGSESAPASEMNVGNAKVEESYAVELDVNDIDALLAAFDDYSYPDNEVISLSGDDIRAMFPEGYFPFTINSNRKFVINGSGGDNDEDISAETWIGFGSDADELIIYTEITDDAIVRVPEDVTTGAAWDYDGWEIGLGNYSPESFIISSTHTSFQRGDAPDYQFRAGLYEGRAAYVHTNYHAQSAAGGEVPNSFTIGEVTDYGYRMLTFIDTFFLAGGDENDAAFDFPAGEEVKTYPFMLAINDGDATNRDTQVGWSNRINEAVDDWWNNPTRWQTIAFVGIDAVVTSIDEEPGTSTPYVFSLSQNYPNPFNPTTNIEFSLANSSNVTLEVFNMLGQKVATLLRNEKMTAGQHTQTFNASNLSSGMYIYRISTPSFVQSRKLVLIK